MTGRRLRLALFAVVLAGCPTSHPVSPARRGPPPLSVAGSGAVSHGVLLDRTHLCGGRATAADEAGAPGPCDRPPRSDRPDGGLWIQLIETPDLRAHRDVAPARRQADVLVRLGGGSHQLPSPTRATFIARPTVDGEDPRLELTVDGPGCLRRRGAVPLPQTDGLEEPLLRIHLHDTFRAVRLLLDEDSGLPPGTDVRIRPSEPCPLPDWAETPADCFTPAGRVVAFPAARPCTFSIEYETPEGHAWTQRVPLERPPAAPAATAPPVVVSPAGVPRPWRFRVMLRGRDVTARSRCREVGAQATFACDEAFVSPEAPRSLVLEIDAPGGHRAEGVGLVAAPPTGADPARAPLDVVAAMAGCWLSLKPRLEAGGAAAVERVIARSLSDEPADPDQLFLPPGPHRLEIWHRVPAPARVGGHQLMIQTITLDVSTDDELCDVQPLLPRP